MGQKSELVIVDPTIKNYQSIINGLERPADVYVIPKSGNSLDVINYELAKRQGIDAVHLFIDNNADGLKIGNITISSNNISDFKIYFTNWWSFLQKNSEILIYCNQSFNEEKISLIIQSIARQTGALVKVMINPESTNYVNNDKKNDLSTGNSKIKPILTIYSTSTYIIK